MSGLYFLPCGIEKTDCQVWSLDRSSTAHQRYEEKQQAIYIQQVLLHASSFHLLRARACERQSEDRGCCYCQLD